VASDGSKGATSPAAEEVPARGQPAEMRAPDSEHAASPAPRSSLAEEGDGSCAERTAAGGNGSSAKETSGSSSEEVRGPDVDEVARLFSLREQLLADLAGVGAVGADTPDTPAAGGGGAAEHPADVMGAPAAVVSALEPFSLEVREEPGASSLVVSALEPFPRAAAPEAARGATAPSAGGTAPRGSPAPKVLPTREVLSYTDVPGAPAPDEGSNGRAGDAEKASRSSGAGTALEPLGSGAGAAAGDVAAPPEDAASGGGAAQAGGSGGQGSGRWGRGGAGQTLRLAEGTTKVLHQAGGAAA
jgi:hypothetical protein